MYGVLMPNGHRPKSKKAIKEALANGHSVYLQNTSLYGGASGSTASVPDGAYTFVGPDPYTDRRFYGTLTKRGGVVKVS